MLDTVTYIKGKYRMCRSQDSCYDCPFYDQSVELLCSDWEGKHPEEATEIVEKWSEEHPQKTLKDDFLEKYSNAPINKEYGFPLSLCPSELGYKNKCTNAEKYISGCAACWNRLLSEALND